MFLFYPGGACECMRALLLFSSRSVQGRMLLLPPQTRHSHFTYKPHTRHNTHSMLCFHIHGPPNYKRNLFSGKSIENGWFKGGKIWRKKRNTLLCINLEFSFRGKFSVFVPSYQMKMGEYKCIGNVWLEKWKLYVLVVFFCKKNFVVRMKIFCFSGFTIKCILWNFPCGLCIN